MAHQRCNISLEVGTVRQGIQIEHVADGKCSRADRRRIEEIGQEIQSATRKPIDKARAAIKILGSKELEKKELLQMCPSKMPGWCMMKRGRVFKEMEGTEPKKTFFLAGSKGKDFLQGEIDRSNP